MGEEESSWTDALEHAASATVEFVASAGETAIEGTVAAFEAAGASADDAAALVAPELKAVPIVGAVISSVEVAYHAGAAIYDGATGDWDGAADQSLKMAEGAINVATFGGFGAGMAVWDAGNAIAGGDSSTSAHELYSEGTEALGNAIGEGVYDVTHPSEE
jgi:hypothetical protein